jgi:phage FluMu gp28-like protein
MKKYLISNIVFKQTSRDLIQNYFVKFIKKYNVLCGDVFEFKMFNLDKTAVIVYQIKYSEGFEYKGFSKVI